MKKRIILLAAIFSGFVLHSQENDLKNFRFGLKAAPSLNWYKPENSKKQESDGSSLKFGGGLMMEFRLNDVISVATGLEVNLDGGKINYIDTANYFFYDDEIVKFEDVPAPTASNYADYKEYRLQNRKFSSTYVTIPIGLKMKTKEIGMLKYYGQFGFNPSFRWKAKAKDEVLDGVTKSTQEDVDVTKDMNFINMALNVGGGTEINVSGSTSIVLGLNFILGFSNAVDKESDYTFEKSYSTSGLSYNSYKQDFKSRAIQLTVGVLF